MLNNRISFLFACTLLFLLSNNTYSQDVQDVTIWAAPAEQKVRPNDQFESDNLVWSEDTKEIQVAGAGNEHVPFQIIISTPDPGDSRVASEDYTRPEELNDLFIEVSDLTSNNGELISREQIELFLEHYVLLYGKSSMVGDTGYWPDALAPIEEPFGMDAEFSVVSNRPIWLDVKIPSDTPGGLYSGDITITHQGEKLETLNVELEVYDFTLPEETSLITYINTSRGRLANFYGVAPSSEKAEKLTKTYYQSLYDNRMEPWFHDMLQPDITVNGSEVSVDFDEQEYQYYLEELSTKRVLLEAYPSELESHIENEEFSEEFNEMITSYLSKIVLYFEENGWKDRLVFNSPVDEPNTEEEYIATREWANLVQEATGNVPFLSTESPVNTNPEWGTLRGYVQNFSVHGNALNSPEVKKVINEEQQKGGEITWYISCDQTYPQPNYFIDAPALDPVMVPWITARYNMNGILYWATVHWSDTPNPWRDAVSFNSGFLCSDGYVLNGEGYMFYPGNYTEEFTGQPDVNGPVSSMRFELLREGIEDYVYLSMLEDLGAHDFADQKVEELVVDVSSFSRNLETLYLTRKEMARRIEELIND